MNSGGGLPRLAQPRVQNKPSSQEDDDDDTTAAPSSNQETVVDLTNDDTSTFEASSSSSFGGYDYDFGTQTYDDSVTYHHPHPHHHSHQFGYDNGDDAWMQSRDDFGNSTLKNDENKTGTVGGEVATSGGLKAFLGKKKRALEEATSQETLTVVTNPSSESTHDTAIANSRTLDAHGSAMDPHNVPMAAVDTHQPEEATPITPRLHMFASRNGPPPSFPFQNKIIPSGAMPTASVSTAPAMLGGASAGAGAGMGPTVPSQMTTGSSTQGTVFLSKNPRFLPRNQTTTNAGGRSENEPPMGVHTAPTQVYPTEMDSPQDMFQTPARSFGAPHSTIAANQQQPRQQHQRPLVTPGSSSSDNRKHVSFAPDVDLNKTTTTTPQLGVHPVPATPKVSHDTSKMSSHAPIVVEGSKPSFETVIPGGDTGIGQPHRAMAAARTTDTTESDFDRAHQIFVQNSRDTNDRVNVANDVILDLNVVVDSQLAERLLLQADMVDLIDVLQVAESEVGSLIHEFSDAFRSEDDDVDAHNHLGRIP